MKIDLGKVIAIVAVASATCCIGCGKDTAAERFFKTGQGRFLSPDKPILQPDEAQLSWIIQSMGDLDKTEELYPSAAMPGPDDWTYADTDYVIGPGDVLVVTIQDLYYEGTETPLQREVSNSGYIDLPLLKNRIRAEGLTEMELIQAVENAYSPSIIREKPVISVSVMVRRKQTFSVLGAVLRPGTYNLVRQDMRLLEALALSGGISQSNIDYLYVIRSSPAVRKSEAAGTPASMPVSAPGGAPSAPGQAVPTGTPRPAEGQLRDINDLMKGSAIAPTEVMHSALFPATVQFAAVSDGSPMPASTQARSLPAPSPSETPGVKTHRWVYRNGEWVREEVTAPPAAPIMPEPQPGVPAATVPAAQEELLKPQTLPSPRPPLSAPPKPMPPTAPQPEESKDPFGWAKVEKTDLVRVIAVNIKKLEQGDYRMNIVIRENDTVQVPSLEYGEFYIMGEVLRPGAYSLTGRQVTIKQALASAGNLGPLAWPENSILIRRIGKNQEQMIPIDIESILRGTEPDVYLKPNDIIAVGTHWATSFLAVMRNAFRMTYGFGFIYDRNFADPLTIYPNSKRFKGW